MGLLLPKERRRGVPQRAPHPGRGSTRDAGHLAALEAVFIGMLLVSSVVFVASVQTRPDPPRATRAPMEAAVADLLQGFYDLPTVDRHDSQLEKLVAKAVFGNATGFESLVDRTLPALAECRLWLDNGHQRRLLLGPSERLARESVSASQLWRPTWSYAFVVPTQDVVGELQPLELQGYGVAQGALVKEHGVPVIAEVTTDLGVYERAAVTSLRDGPTASLYLLDEGGTPSYHYTDAAATLTNTTLYTAAKSGTPVSTTFSVPAGQTFLDVRTAYTGAVVAYTLTLTSPNGIPYLVPAVGAGTVHANLTLPEGTAGLWTLTGSGSLTGSLLHPASSTVSVTAQALSLNDAWTFVVREEAGRALPAGTTLTLRFPAAFSGLEQTSAAQPGWRNLNATLSLTEGNTLTAELDSPLSGGQRTFTAVGKRPANGDALYLVRAELGNGTSARATVVLGQAGITTGTPNDIQRGLYLSVPKPMAPGSSATWGIVFDHPATGAGTAETLTKVDLRTADGSPLFAAVSGLRPATGWTLLSPAHLQWTGSVAVAANAATTFAARVTAVAANSTHEPAHRLPVGFGGGSTTFETPDLARTHIHSINVPPSSDALGNPQRGYGKPAMSGAVPKGASSATVDWFVRGVRASGEVPYEVSTFLPLATVQEAVRLGVARSHLDLSTTSARLGDTVEIGLDFRALLDQAGLFGATLTAWHTELALYDPAQPFESRGAMQPSWKGSFGSNLTLMPASSNVSAIVPWALTDSQVRHTAAANFTFRVPEGAFYGPHAVLAQTAFVLNDGFGNALPQTVRLLGVLDVVPDSGQAETALYWVTLECWLPDW